MRYNVSGCDTPFNVHGHNIGLLPLTAAGMCMDWQSTLYQRWFSRFKHKPSRIRGAVYVYPLPFTPLKC